MKTEKSAFLPLLSAAVWLALAAWLPAQVEAEPAHLGAKGADSSADKAASTRKNDEKNRDLVGREPRERAADAYDAGAEALARKDFLTAARSFEQAHRIQPSEVAREQAIKSYTLAGDVAHAASLALQAPRDHEQLLRDALARHALVAVECDGCTLELDGESTAAPSFIVAAGAHRLRGHFAQGSVLKRFSAQAGQRMTLRLQAPAAEGEPTSALAAPSTALSPPEPQRATDSGGLPKVVTYTLFGLTAAAIGASTWSLFDMQSAAQRYDSELTRAVQSPNAQSVARASDALEAARSAEQRTHWLIGTSAALIASSAVVGLLLTDWDGDAATSEGPHLALAPGRAVASWRHSW